MSKFFILPVLLLVSYYISGQETRAGAAMNGRILDASTGKPLAGASIGIEDARRGTIADSTGAYSLLNLPPGHHVVEVSFTGYGSVVAHMDIIGTVQQDFRLSSVVVENQGVIVTGVSSATSIRKASVPLLSIRKEELLQTPSTNIIDALSRKPGIAQVGTGPGISKPVIRGLGYNRVVVVNDGVRQEGQQWGDEHGIEIDEMSVNKVEIIKGPASLMYGSDGLAGVIHLISHTPVAQGTTPGNVMLNYQTNNGLAGIHANLAGNTNGLNWNAYGSFKSAGDYRNKYDGRVLNSRFNEKNFGGYIGLNKHWGFSHLVFSGFNQHVGLVEGDRDDATGSFLVYPGSTLEHVATSAELKERKPLVPKQNIRHYKIISDNSFSINRSRLKINLAYQQNQRREFGNPLDPDEEELAFDLSTFSYTIHWQIPQASDWHVTVGANGMAQQNRNGGEEVIIPEYGIFDVGAFVFGQRFYNRATLSGGLRIDHRSVKSHQFFEDSEERFAPFTRKFTNVAGSIGVSIEPSDEITLKLNAARGFRAPNMAELGSNGAHEGTDRYEYGATSLNSETSLQFDGGIDVEKEHFSLGIGIFYNRISNFIYYRKLNSVFGGDSIVNVDGEDLVGYRFDQQDASLAGFEAELDIHPHPFDWLHFENSYSFVRGWFHEEVDGSSNLPMIPAARWTSELRGNFARPGKSLRNVYIKSGIIMNLRQDKPFTGYDTETETASYTLFNVGIGGEVHSKKRQLFSVHLFANNLLDVAYVDHLSRLKYAAVNEVTGRSGVFNMGRNFGVKMNIAF